MAKIPSARWSVATGLIVAIAMFAACSSDEEPGGAAGGAGSTADAGPLLEADCAPIGNYCGFPFPSNVYLREDPSGKNKSGKRIQFGAATLPKTGGQTPISPELFHDLDGFSPASAPMTYLPGATATGLPTPLEIGSTLQNDSPTILLDAQSGELVPHWIDIDQN